MAARMGFGASTGGLNNIHEVRGVVTSTPADVGVTKTVSGTRLFPGQAVVYTITVVNSGNGAATNVTVADPLLPGLSCTPANGSTLAAGATMTCTGTHVLTSTDIGNGSVSNTATVSGGNVCNPTTLGSTCSDTEVTPLVLLPDLMLTKTHGGSFVLYALFAQAPGAHSFASYLPVDSSISCMPDQVYAWDRAYADAYTELPVKVHLSYASGGNGAANAPFGQTIEQHRYGRLGFRSVLYTGTHSGIVPTAFSEGLAFALG